MTDNNDLKVIYNLSLHNEALEQLRYILIPRVIQIFRKIMKMLAAINEFDTCVLTTMKLI